MNKSRPVTLQSLARQLGLNVSTVSRVLNGSDDDARAAAAPDTVKRVRALAAELQYRTNPHAASLKTRRSRTIGVLVPRLSDMVLATIYEGVDEAAAEHGYLTFVSNTQDEPDKQRKLIDMALARRVDGLILVCAGAGGHAGTLSPFALVSEVRRFYDGPLILSGAITSGAQVLAALAMGVDFAYMGTRFIASEEANASEGYKSAIVEASASDILYTPFFTGIPGNYLKASISAAGLDPANLPQPDSGASNFGSSRVKPWKDIWGAGQGVGNIGSVQPTHQIVDTLRREYAEARTQLAARTFA